MSRAALAVGRHLHLVRDEHDTRIAKAVSAISTMDARLSESPPDPTWSAASVGNVEKFSDPYSQRPRISWVLRLPGGEDVIVLAPMRLDTSAVASAVDNLMDTALAENYPG